MTSLGAAYLQFGILFVFPKLLNDVVNVIHRSLFYVLKLVYMTVLWVLVFVLTFSFLCFFFQAEDGIRDLVRSRGLECV